MHDELRGHLEQVGAFDGSGAIVPSVTLDRPGASDPRVHGAVEPTDSASEPAPTLLSSDVYDEDYFDSHCGGRPYRRGEPHWEAYFRGIADSIVRSFSPRTVFDAGCAMGFLVEALWDRGVEAHGRDVSAFAIGQVRPDLRDYCSVGSITDPIESHYDLVVCIEVLEHLDAEEADLAVDRLTVASDRILFSSTPNDFGEPTHRCVRPPIYWLRRFRERGFAPVLSHDATYVSPQAFLLERSTDRVLDDVLAGANELVRVRVQLHEVLRRNDPRTLRPSEAVLMEQDLERRFEGVAHELQHQQAEAEAARQALRALESTRTFRYTRLLRRTYGLVRGARQPVTEQSAVPRSSLAVGASYDLWLREFAAMDDTRRATLQARLDALRDRPLASVIMPVFDTPEPFLRAAIESVLAQVYENWELCIVDDASTAAWIPEVLDEYSQRDERVRVVRRAVNGHISAASNTALEIARGEWVVLLDHDDALTEHALALAALAIADHPGVGLVYSDEDRIDELGRMSLPFFKPDFDPVLLLAQNYVCHMTMVRRALIEKVGRFREGLEGSQDWDLVLRVTELLAADEVCHIPHVCYHWRAHRDSTAAGLEAKPYAADAGALAVSDHLGRQGREAQVLLNSATGIVRVKWPLPSRPPRVSIIVPTRDGRHLAACLRSLFSTTSYPDFEVVIVDNGSVGDEAHQLFRDYGRVATILSDDRPFNFSALNNRAVAQCSGDVVCFLNDDCEITDHGWLEEMVGQVCQPGVGVVGAKLLYPDGRIQHAGVVLGIGGTAGHPNRFLDHLDYGYFGWLETPRSLSAVTGACMAVRRSIFEQVGGFDEVNLSVAFNDIDFCLRVREAGWRTVWTPHAVLMHHESTSRGDEGSARPRRLEQEEAYMARKWGHRLRADPAYNTNLTLEDTNFSLAFPPRALWWSP